MPELSYLDAAALRSLIDLPQAVEALCAALVRGDVDPENDSPRLFSPAPEGEFLLMPTAGPNYCGVKALTLAPGNPERGLPRVQGVYTLFRNDDLAPVALLDASELTLIRTPATTLLAALRLLEARHRDPRSLRVVVVGTGPQADRHARAVHQLLQPRQIRIVGRRGQAAHSLAARLCAEGVPAQAGAASELTEADLVICVTSSRSPVLQDADIRDEAIVVAVGTHGLDAREVPAELARRAFVVVEGRASAMREAGNLISARPVAEWEAIGLPNLQDLARASVSVPDDRPTLYSGVGMAWEDLVIATAVHHAAIVRADPVGGVTKEPQ
ncbi:MAG TPA: hypothetical protein VNQ73_12265 [Ilumatobacter sp.]|nr:hypothetical protein [Ilumatobacter sp.]